MKEALDDTNRLAGADGLPDVRINDKGLKISPLEDETPPEAKLLKSQTYGLLPHVKITDLLLEVDRWTNFTRHFTHLKTAEPAVDRALLLNAILADAFNLGLEKYLGHRNITHTVRYTELSPERFKGFWKD